MATWHTPVTLRDQWAQAPKSDTLVGQLLAAAKDQVLDHGIILVAGVATTARTVLEVDPAPSIPERFVLAQGMQARAIWESQRASVSGNDDAIGLEGFQVRVYSMAKPVRDLIVPPFVAVG